LLISVAARPWLVTSWCACLLSVDVQRNGQAALTWIADRIPRWFSHPKTVNRTHYSVILFLLINRNALPLSQTLKKCKVIGTSINIHPTTFNSCFWSESGLACSPQFFFHRYGREPLGISGTKFFYRLDAIPITDITTSTSATTTMHFMTCPRQPRLAGAGFADEVSHSLSWLSVSWPLSLSLLYITGLMFAMVNRLCDTARAAEYFAVTQKITDANADICCCWCLSS